MVIHEIFSGYEGYWSEKLEKLCDHLNISILVIVGTWYNEHSDMRRTEEVDERFLSYQEAQTTGKIFDFIINIHEKLLVTACFDL